MCAGAWAGEPPARKTHTQGEPHGPLARWTTTQPRKKAWWPGDQGGMVTRDKWKNTGYEEEYFVDPDKWGEWGSGLHHARRSVFRVFWLEWGRGSDRQLPGLWGSDRKILGNMGQHIGKAVDPVASSGTYCPRGAGQIRTVAGKPSTEWGWSACKLLRIAAIGVWY